MPSAYAGGMITADDDKYIAIGMGIRQSFNSQENASANSTAYSNEFVINNARIYVDGQLHKYIKFTFNTECFNCAGNGGNGASFGSNSSMGLLDAIGKFEINGLVNLWVGRTLVPTERGELNGPFYHAVFDSFSTPFNPADFGGNIGAGGAGSMAVTMARSSSGKSIQVVHICNTLRRCSRGCGQPGAQMADLIKETA